jgi:hypothetical protein
MIENVLGSFSYTNADQYSPARIMPGFVACFTRQLNQSQMEYNVKSKWY